MMFFFVSVFGIAGVHTIMNIVYVHENVSDFGIKSINEESYINGFG